MHSIIVLLSGTSDGCKLSRRKELVPKKGLEPPHPCEYMDLNHARLPIPPLRHYVAPDQTRRCDGKYSSILKGLLNVSNPGRRQSPGSAALKQFQSYCILLHHAQSPRRAILSRAHNTLSPSMLTVRRRRIGSAALKDRLFT